MSAALGVDLRAEPQVSYFPSKSLWHLDADRTKSRSSQPPSRWWGWTLARAAATCSQKSAPCSAIRALSLAFRSSVNFRAPFRPFFAARSFHRARWASQSSRTGVWVAGGGSWMISSSSLVPEDALEEEERESVF